MQSVRNLSCTSDDDLIEALKQSHRGERKHLVEFLRIFAEVDARKLYVERGFSSAFVFLTKGLSMSEDQAYRRVATARAGRRFPRIFEMIEAGELHMTGAAKLAKHLDEDNHTALLDAARHRSKAEIELLIATRFPAAPAKTSVRRRSASSPAQPVQRGTPPAQPVQRALGPERRASPPAEPTKPSRPPVTPTSETTYTFRFSGSERAKQLLDRSKELLPPGTDVGDVFERALGLLVTDLEKKKFKTTDKPRTVPAEDAPSGERYVPAAVKRTVYERDGGRCTYVSTDERRCCETKGLEFDHVVPVARGGKSIVANVRLRCRAHNQFAAQLVFGRAFMERKRRSTLPGQSGRALS